MGKVIGIDLGTTNSAVAVMEGEQAVIITNSEGARTTPSVVAFSKNGERFVGEKAKRQASVNTDRTISSIKRRMGSDYRVHIDDKEYSPQEISAMILKKLKKDAENYLGESVNEAVITVPAYYTDAQRQATKDAGRIAGLDVKRIINEPTAAALAYGLDNGESQKILVYDLGGGTFDVSIIELGDDLIEVLSTAGDNHLGGDDFDERLAQFMVEQFQKYQKVKICKDVTAMARIREEAEKAKKELSFAENYNVNLPFITTRKGEPVHMQMNITRKMLEELIRDLVDRTETPVRTALNDAHLTPMDIDRVLLVGGSTRIPMVVTKVKNMLGREPSKSINPDECVAIGAAIQGGKMTTGSYALSADSKVSQIVLMDVTPLSLSVETIGGIANRIIERNETIPVRQSKIFSTAMNFQTTVEVKVYQGERRFTRDNKLLASFKLEGIKRALAGTPQIEVTFDIDVNGILKVSAKDLGTGRQQQVTITSTTNLSEEEIERACADAARYESEENRRLELVEIRNEAESLVYSVEERLDKAKSSMDRAEYKQIRADKDELKKMVVKTSPERITEMEAGRIKEAMEVLRASSARL
ncbi:MAG: molecular chaperone DnaK [Lachnospiraceae bacterium]|nr:molecular chaperone DnaK [Lachnospiraceae bacterium]